MSDAWVDGVKVRTSDRASELGEPSHASSRSSRLQVPTCTGRRSILACFRFELLLILLLAYFDAATMLGGEGNAFMHPRSRLTISTSRSLFCDTSHVQASAGVDLYFCEGVAFRLIHQ